MEKISLTDLVKNEVLLIVKEVKTVLHKVNRKNANWIGHALRRNCLLKYVCEGKVEGKRKTGKKT
jgi:hypothetical protein